MSVEQVIADWLDENVTAIDPGMDEIANLIINKMLVEHSCCDAQTFQFNDELYSKVLHAQDWEEGTASHEDGWTALTESALDRANRDDTEFKTAT